MEFDTLARHGVQRRRRDGQQRHLGAREAPDGVPLRLLGGRRAAARRRATTRWSRRSAGTASWCERPDELRPALERAFAAGQAGAGERAHRPGGRLPALARTWPERQRPETRSRPRRGGRLQVGPVRTGRGTCLEGPLAVRTAGGADDAASPGPMRRAGRRREARPPMPTARVSAVSTGSGNRTDVQNSARLGFRPWRPSSAAPQRMSCSETSTSSSPNAPSTSSRIDDAGDDRRARGRGAGPGLAALARAAARRAASSIASSAVARQDVALDARGVVGLERRGRSRRTEVGVPATATAAAHALAHARRAPRAVDRRAHVARRARRARAAAGGSACRWRSVWRTTPTWVETWKPHLAARARRRARSSRRRCRSRAAASRRRVARRGRAEEGQPRLLVAAERARVEAEALAHARARTRRRWRRRGPRRSSRRSRRSHAVRARSPRA